MQLTSVKPPSVHVQEKVGKALAPLGVEYVNSQGTDAVELRFKDPKDVEVANAAFNDSIDGVKLLFRDADGNGVRGIASDYAIVDGIAKLGGVQTAGAGETSPLQAHFTVDSDATAASLKLLLRPVAADGTSLSVKVGSPAPQPAPAPATPGLVEAELGMG